MRGDGRVERVHSSGAHEFSKPEVAEIHLIPGIGVDGDAHAGSTVQHRSRVAQDPSQPNLRQVHLIHAELFDELAEEGYQVVGGDLGENITTRGVDLLSLPVGASLRVGGDALVAVTGLRNPCQQIERFRTGLLSHVVGRDAAGALVRKAGVMGVVVQGGTVRAGDSITVACPPPPHVPLERV